MLEQYENLYTDISCQRIVVKKYASKFQADYKRLCAEFPIVKQRLIYGTDWHCLIRVPDFINYKRKFIEVLQYEDNFSDEEIEDFLGGNALRFLGFSKGSPAALRLERFYAEHQIEAPEWFTLLK